MGLLFLSFFLALFFGGGPVGSKPTSASLSNSLSLSLSASLDVYSIYTCMPMYVCNVYVPLIYTPMYLLVPRLTGDTYICIYIYIYLYA